MEGLALMKPSELSMFLCYMQFVLFTDKCKSCFLKNIYFSMTNFIVAGGQIDTEIAL